MMRKQQIAMVAAAAALAGMAWADSPHFIYANGSLNGDGYYVGSFKEAGLGPNQSITYNLTAGDGTVVTFQCYTKSNNTPHGAPNSVYGPLSTTGTFNSGKNGQITSSLTIVPEPADTCQGGGLKLCLVYADYKNVTLKDMTNYPAVPAQSLPDLGPVSYINSSNRPTNCS